MSWNKININVLVGTIFYVLFCFYENIAAFDFELEQDKHITPSIRTIIMNFKNRYNTIGFEADFYQTIMLNQTDLIETAKGKLSVLTPNNVKWEYVEPYFQTIIYTNDSVKIFNPMDNQIIVINAKSLETNGIDMSFISNVNDITRKFSVFLDTNLKSKNLYRLKLVPKTSLINLFDLYIDISKINFDILALNVVTTYGNEINIKFKNINLNPKLSLDMFKLDTSEDIDIIELNS